MRRLRSHPPTPWRRERIRRPNPLAARPGAPATPQPAQLRKWKRATSEEVSHGGAVVLHRPQVIAHGPAGDTLVWPASVGAIDGEVRHTGLLPSLKLLTPLGR